jgi:hypothetical protein
MGVAECKNQKRCDQWRRKADNRQSGDTEIEREREREREERERERDEAQQKQCSNGGFEPLPG